MVPKPEGCQSLHEAGVCIKRNFQTERQEVGKFLRWEGVALAGFAGATRVRAAAGRDWGALGAWLPVEFAPELSACTGLPGRGSEAQTKLGTRSSRRGGPQEMGGPSPGALTPHLGAAPLPQQAHPSPNPRAAKPSISHPGTDIHKSH